MTKTKPVERKCECLFGFGDILYVRLVWFVILNHVLQFIMDLSPSLSPCFIFLVLFFKLYAFDIFLLNHFHCCVK